MNQNVKTELDKIVSVLAETGIVTKIILFGSYARGDETPDSDIDLCVITPVNDKRPIELMSGFRKKLRGVKTMPLDLLAFNQNDFSYRAAYAGSLEHEFAKEGMVLYEHK